MKLTEKTFTGMVRLFRSAYGATWRSDLDDDAFARLNFFYICQSVIPEEMVSELIRVFCATRQKAPESPFDIVQAYIDKQLENALSSDDVIDKIVIAIREFEQNESPFASRDDYIISNVIWVFPCSEAVKQFYLRNKVTLNYLALQYPDEDEKRTIYKDLGFDYRKLLHITERQMIVNKIQALPCASQSAELLEE